MKNILALFVLLLCSLSAFSQSYTGKWKTIDDKTGEEKSIVEIYEQNGKLYGKVIEILTDKKDVKCDNCKGSEKGKPVKGLVIIKGLEKNGSSYSGGTITDPGSGKQYKCAIKLNGQNKLEVRGYIGIQALGRTQTWIRI